MRVQIRTTTLKDGSKRFYPQKRFLWSWWDFMRVTPLGHHIPVFYSTKAGAARFLFKKTGQVISGMSGYFIEYNGDCTWLAVNELKEVLRHQFGVSVHYLTHDPLKAILFLNKADAEAYRNLWCDQNETFVTEHQFI